MAINNSLRSLGARIHRICPLCFLKRRFPKTLFASIMRVWERSCSCCRCYVEQTKGTMS